MSVCFFVRVSLRTHNTHTTGRGGKIKHALFYCLLVSLAVRKKLQPLLKRTGEEAHPSFFQCFFITVRTQSLYKRLLYTSFIFCFSPFGQRCVCIYGVYIFYILYVCMFLLWGVMRMDEMYSSSFFVFCLVFLL